MIIKTFSTLIWTIAKELLPRCNLEYFNKAEIFWSGFLWIDENQKEKAHPKLENRKNKPV